MPHRSAASHGLAFVLAATALAGVSGYAIQLLAPSALGMPSSYLAFSVFWSTMFLFGGAVGGVQQEIARATRPASGEPKRTVARFSLVAVGAVVVLGAAVGLLLAPLAFRQDPVGLVFAFMLGLVGYVLTSVLTGVLYGLARLGTVASLISVDAVMRGIAVLLAFWLDAPPAVLGLAIAVPFGASVSVVWIAVRRRVADSYTLDLDTSALLRNAVGTVTGAASIGVMVTGMPLLFGTLLPDSGGVVVATLTLVVTVTRAPLIIPLMALQSFMIVSFRAAGDRRRRRVMLTLGGVLALSAVCALGSAWIGPAAIDLISGYTVDGWLMALVVASAGLIAAMCVTGAALLALSRHGAYVAGWAIAAVFSVALLAVLPLDAVSRAAVALVLAPSVGLGVHLIMAVRLARSV
ncbi:MAG: hypothetical protein JF592_03790 [Microbacterium sp.]|uniref:hypothetical protein n=1 Tax=Microbacterium sp. TaxID=51671 RepID=UPI001D385FA5|nr:hypothetical protein [Microbacterium sp.]MBW8761692.1 hypothetical protein [Microbacterium sp.]